MYFKLQKTFLIAFWNELFSVVNAVEFYYTF